MPEMAFGGRGGSDLVSVENIKAKHTAIMAIPRPERTRVILQFII
jgi:hypothetical protein